MVGYVQVFEEGKLIYEGHNLVVLSGRQVLQHRLTNVGTYKDYYLSYFSMGDGGADPANPLLPIAPQETDTDLAHTLVFDSSNPNYKDGGKKKPITSITHQSQTQTIVELDIATTDNGGQQNPFYINELGLFAANATGTSFRMVARITFPSIVKDPQRSQKIYWWLFF